VILAIDLRGLASWRFSCSTCHLRRAGAGIAHK
jgi:hypothetical protein